MRSDVAEVHLYVFAECQNTSALHTEFTERQTDPSYRATREWGKMQSVRVFIGLWDFIFSHVRVPVSVCAREKM